MRSDGGRRRLLDGRYVVRHEFARLEEQPAGKRIMYYCRNQASKHDGMLKLWNQHYIR